MKRIIGLLTVLALTMSLFVGCGGKSTINVGSADSSVASSTTSESSNASSAGNGKNYKVAMIYQNLGTQFNIYFQDVLKARCNELGVDLIEFDGQGSAEKQLSQAENAIQQKVDVLMFIPQDKSGCAPIIDKANAANIPVIGCNNVTDNIDEATAYVGANDIEAGIMEMEYMAKLLNGKGNIAVIHGPFGHSAEVSRQQGIVDTLKKYPDIKIIEENTANWDRTQAMQLMENWIQKNGNKINAVVCHSDDMAMGALQAIQAAKLDIKAIGVDAIKDALQSVKKGEMSATVFQDVYGQAEGAIKVAMQILNGEEYKKTTYVPFQLVTQDNADEYLKNFE